MPIGTAAALLGSAVIGGVASSSSAKKAAKAQTTAATQATGLEQQQLAQSQAQYEQSRTDTLAQQEQARTDLAPYREAGYTALGQLGTGTAAGGEFNRDFTTADFEADPGYQFRLDEGNRGVQASAAAKGGVLSGGTLKALARYNQGEASQEYGAAYNRYTQNTTDRYNRIASLAGVGQTATNSGIASGQTTTTALNALGTTNTANQQAGTTAISNNIMAAGNANASQYVAQGNAIGNLAGQVGQYYALRDMISSPAARNPYGLYGAGGIY